MLPIVVLPSTARYTTGSPVRLKSVALSRALKVNPYHLTCGTSRARHSTYTPRVCQYRVKGTIKCLQKHQKPTYNAIEYRLRVEDIQQRQIPENDVQQMRGTTTKQYLPYRGFLYLPCPCMHPTHSVPYCRLKTPCPRAEQNALHLAGVILLLDVESPRSILPLRAST